MNESISVKEANTMCQHGTEGCVVSVDHTTEYCTDGTKVNGHIRRLVPRVSAVLPFQAASKYPAWWDVFELLPADGAVLNIGQRQELAKAIVAKLESRVQQSFGDAPNDVRDDAARNLPAESLQPGSAAGAQPAASMNHLQRRTLMRLMETLRGADEVDVQVRKDGQTHHFEIDWLRDALAASFGGETQQAYRAVHVREGYACTFNHPSGLQCGAPATRLSLDGWHGRCEEHADGK